MPNSKPLNQTHIHSVQNVNCQFQPNYHNSSTTIMSINKLPLFLMVMLLSAAFNEASLTQVNGSLTSEELVPLMEPVKVVEMKLMLNETRRRLSGFKICALCTCCGGAKGVCLSSPCCYAINCNIPNRPFGFCSFTPKTCNCFGCHL